ncbi:hypothetical protein [Streptomyces sp. NPDC048462]|uniref:hypothetical protein n=1 Tax=Streptomyces sp. NPDC048462 TaxID=3365555 RepID=UPI003717F4A6
MNQKITPELVEGILESHAEQLLDLLADAPGGATLDGLSWVRSADAGTVRFRIAVTVESTGITRAVAEARIVAEDPAESTAEREAARRFLRAAA